MSIIQVTGKGGKIHHETLFVGSRIPTEIKRLYKHLKNIERHGLIKILKVILYELESQKVEDQHWLQLQETVGTSEEQLAIIYGGLRSLLRAALRCSTISLKPEIMKEDLRELQIPEHFVDDITSIVFGPKRDVIDQHSLDSRPSLPKLANLHWRVDVAISTSVLNRALEPSILMELRLSNGKVLTFEVSVDKFHELRYSVAHLLKEMEDIERRSILKIQD